MIKRVAGKVDIPFEQKNAFRGETELASFWRVYL